MVAPSTVDSSSSSSSSRISADSNSIKSLIFLTNAHLNYFKNIKLLKTFKITTLGASVVVLKVFDSLIVLK